MQERRKHKRYEIEAKVTEINGTMALAKNVKILNISPGGICLQTEERLNIDSQYALTIEGKGRVLTVKCSVIWDLTNGTSADSDGNVISVYKTGIKFIDVSREKINEIANFIEAHKREFDRSGV